MTLAELHEQYGAACIQLEIWQGKVMELKRLIAEKMNEKPTPIIDVDAK